MKIHGYQVVAHGPVNMVDVVRRIGTMPYEDRAMQLADMDIRLEDFRLDDGLLFMDFAKIRFSHGPGRAPRAAPIRGFRLGDDEGFGEQTAAVFSAQTNYMVLQYNHHGPRAGTIENYLSNFAARLGGGPQEEDAQRAFEFGIVLRPDVYAELRRKRIIKSIDLTVSVPGLRDIDREMGIALGAIADAPLPGGVENISIRLSASRRKGASLAPDEILREARGLLGIRENLKRLVARAKLDEEAPTEAIDLLHGRLEAEEVVEPGRDRRYSVADRWARLRSVYNIWTENGQLPVAG